jgi:hypothetical protein
MLRLLRRQREEPAPQKPVLDLSGPKLRRALSHLVESAEPTGGIERYVSALALKASLFGELLGKGKVEEVTAAEFRDLASFITPARRRIGPYLEDGVFPKFRDRLSKLLDGWSDTATADARLAQFIQDFPQDKDHRFIRDLGAELLHFTAPDRYPLMTRWMWDARVGTGVLREIWFDEQPLDGAIPVADGFATFDTLFEELHGFLAANGVFRDHVFYADLLTAHVYADYINDQGGTYLRSDFAETSDRMMHTRRMLGLDAINTETGRTRLKLIDGTAHVLGGGPQISS